MTQSPTRFGLSEIGQISVNVRDIDASVEFYRDTLGMAPLFTAPGMAFFQCGAVRLMLTIAEKPEFDHPASIIYYRVDNIEAAHHELSERGVSFLAAPHCIHRTPDSELWMAFFQDPSDNTLALMCERPAGM